MASWFERRRAWVDAKEEASNNTSATTPDSPPLAPDERFDPEGPGPTIRRLPTVLPFVLAVIVVGSILAFVIISAVVSSPENNITDTNRIVTAVTNFVDAQNTGNAQELRENTCALYLSKYVPGTGPDVDAAYKTSRSASVGATGNTVIDNIETVVVTGNSATAQVTTHQQKPNAKMPSQWKFIHDGSTWKMCND